MKKFLVYRQVTYTAVAEVYAGGEQEAMQAVERDPAHCKWLGKSDDDPYVTEPTYFAIEIEEVHVD